MKPNRNIRDICRLPALYPTTFRWNSFPRRTVFITCCFISHYVQMKLDFSIHLFVSEFSLYPTTFRWNWQRGQRLCGALCLYIPLRSDETSTRQKTRWPPFNFISHYVQMKPVMTSVTFAALPPLYPTTFRWNFHDDTVAAAQIMLYIPLRSDETPLSKWMSRCIPHFISHYVQMKQFAEANHITTGQSLYPTTFRWN